MPPSARLPLAHRLALPRLDDAHLARVTGSGWGREVLARTWPVIRRVLGGSGLGLTLSGSIRYTDATHQVSASAAADLGRDGAPGLQVAGSLAIAFPAFHLTLAGRTGLAAR
ncbi:hypothetical protein [Mesoterricola sediminis]|uniref:Uncharacterized protein n=1 Tax=Mesoterricola sediminis TaxID=2927980 RepID=A0AA48GWL5_9BACT|nr:hypothetical protein [Mesoterricola sediminis]BDU75750.1 hypothetical protein METESE_07080 [Mesoterricola sediminis]